MKTCS